MTRCGSVLVTGANGGIGTAISHELSRAGWRVIGMDVTAPQGEDSSSYSAVVDVSDLTQVTSALEVALADGQPLRAVVNAAGVFRHGPLLETTEAERRDVLRSNLEATITVCIAAIPHLRQAGGGAIVNFASTAGEGGSVRPAAVYAAAKAGIIGLTKALAHELAPSGIRVNAISPGPVDTKMLAVSSGPERRRFEDATLLGRMGTPRDIALGVAYLLAESGDWITGTVHRINGGSLI